MKTNFRKQITKTKDKKKRKNVVEKVTNISK